MFKLALIAILALLYVITGSYCEQNHIITEPANWSLFGSVWGAISLAIIIS